jgi:hypothetical protein
MEDSTLEHLQQHLREISTCETFGRFECNVDCLAGRIGRLQDHGKTMGPIFCLALSEDPHFQSTWKPLPEREKLLLNEPVELCFTTWMDFAFEKSATYNQFAPP